MTHKEFLALVIDMRAAQKAWFGGDKSSETLALSKALERKVDRAVKELSDPQPSLFSKES